MSSKESGLSKEAQPEQGATPDPGIEAMALLPGVLKVLEGASSVEVCHRIQAALQGVLGVETHVRDVPVDTASDGGTPGTGTYSDFPELYNRSGPPSPQAGKALVAGYWFHVIEETSFTSGDVARLLKTVNTSLSNPSDAIKSLTRRKPNVIFKDGKKGTATLYRLTNDGISAVEKMLP